MLTVAKTTLTRPANTTQYAANDLVANSATAASVQPLIWTLSKLSSGRGIIRRVRLWKDDETTTAAIFKLYLFDDDPGVPTNGDNGAFGVASTRNLIGVVDIDMSSGAVASSTDLIQFADVSPDIIVDLGAVSATERRLYGLLSTGTGGTYTPASGEVFEITLEVAGLD